MSIKDDFSRFIGFPKSLILAMLQSGLITLDIPPTLNDSIIIKIFCIISLFRSGKFNPFCSAGV
jgi:hypothetical protein